MGVEKIRGNLRFEFLCGGRALRDHRDKDRTVRRLAGAFSCAPGDVAGQVERLAVEHKALKKRARHLEERLAAFEAAEVVRTATDRFVSGLLGDKTPEEARFLALNIIRNGEFYVVYGAASESQGHLIAARSESLKTDLRQLAADRRGRSPRQGRGRAVARRAGHGREVAAPRSRRRGRRLGPGERRKTGSLSDAR